MKIKLQSYKIEEKIIMFLVSCHINFTTKVICYRNQNIVTVCFLPSDISCIGEQSRQDLLDTDVKPSTAEGQCKLN